MSKTHPPGHIDLNLMTAANGDLLGSHNRSVHGDGGSGFGCGHLSSVSYGNSYGIGTAAQA